jgi:hypothetical protein
MIDSSSSKELLKHNIHPTDVCIGVGHESLSDEALQATSDLFYELQKEIPTNQGPQAVRLTREELTDSFNDQNTVFAVYDLEGTSTYVPIFVPVRCMSESFDEDLFVSRYDIDKDSDGFAGVYYFTGDVDALEQLEANPNFSDVISSMRVLMTEVERLDEESFSRLFDLFKKYKSDLKIDEFVDPKNQKPASLNHYSGAISIIEPVATELGGSTQKYSGLRDVFLEGVASGDFDPYPYNGATIIDPLEFAQNTEMQDYFWRFCGDQFVELIENFPVVQEPSKEEFIDMLSDPLTINAVYFHEGKPITSCVFVENIENCTWLDGEYFDEKYRDEYMGYFPFLATDKEQTGKGYAGEVMALLTQLINRLGCDYYVTFECTNISEDYVPYLVKLAVETDEKLQIELTRVAEYRIRSLVDVTQRA